jgi:hypothetical protein
MVLRPSWRGVAVEVGLLRVVARRRGRGCHGRGCHAANMGQASCVGFLCAPLNSRLGSALEHATVALAGGVAYYIVVLAVWERLTRAHRLKYASLANLVALDGDNEGRCGQVERESTV